MVAALVEVGVQQLREDDEAERDQEDGHVDQEEPLEEEKVRGHPRTEVPLDCLDVALPQV